LRILIILFYKDGVPMETGEGKKKYKVVHVITKLELGGAQINTIYTYEHLDRELFDAYLISGPGGILTDTIKEKKNFIVMDNLIRAINPLKDFKAFRQLVKYFKSIKPDIVHTHSSKAGIVGRLAARVANVPVIIHSVHGFSFSPFQSFLKRTFFVTAEKLVSRLTSHFIFVAADDVETARSKKLIRGNHSLIRSGFLLERFLTKTAEQKEQKKQKELRSAYRIEENDFVCGIIAPFKPQKGLFHLIEIAERVIKSKKVAQINKNIVFMITGDGALREEIENRLKEKGIFENFRLPGFIFDIQDAIEIFDLGISTALWEGLPQSLVQLRLKKKAVVASDIPGNKEVIRDGVNGYIENVFQYDAFAEKILELMGDQQKRRRLAHYDDNFSEWDAGYMVRKQEELYISLFRN
jgi:glycosyltransferase involved in cell wall biosynthesis